MNFSYILLISSIIITITKIRVINASNDIPDQTTTDPHQTALNKIAQKYAGYLKRSFAENNSLTKLVTIQRRKDEKIIEQLCIKPGEKCNHFTDFGALSHDVLNQYITWVTYRRCLKKMVHNYYNRNPVVVSGFAYNWSNSSIAQKNELLQKPRIEIGFQSPSVKQIMKYNKKIMSNSNQRYLLNCMTICDIGYIRVHASECNNIQPHQVYDQDNSVNYYQTSAHQGASCCKRLNKNVHNICSAKPYATQTLWNNGSKNEFIDFCDFLPNAVNGTCSVAQVITAIGEYDTSSVRCQCKVGYTGRLCQEKACEACVKDKSCVLSISLNKCQCSKKYNYGDVCQYTDYIQWIYSILGKKFSFVLFCFSMTLTLLMVVCCLQRKCLKEARRKRRDSRAYVQKTLERESMRLRKQSLMNEDQNQPLNFDLCQRNKHSSSKNSRHSSSGAGYNNTNNNNNNTARYNRYSHTCRSLPSYQKCIDPILGEIDTLCPSDDGILNELSSFVNHRTSTNNHHIPLSITYTKFDNKSGHPNPDTMTPPDLKIVELPDRSVSTIIENNNNNLDRLDSNQSGRQAHQELKRMISTIDQHIQKMGSLRRNLTVKSLKEIKPNNDADHDDLTEKNEEMAFSDLRSLPSPPILTALNQNTETDNRSNSPLDQLEQLNPYQDMPNSDRNKNKNVGQTVSQKLISSLKGRANFNSLKKVYNDVPETHLQYDARVLASEMDRASIFTEN